MTTTTKPRKSRKQKLVGSTPDPVFVPVHAASMSTPVFDAMVREFGEPNLNPYPPDPGPDFDLVTLFETHKPSVSVKELVPAWAAENTGQYLMDRMALADYVARIAGEKGDNGADDHQTTANGPGRTVAA